MSHKTKLKQIQMNNRTNQTNKHKKIGNVYIFFSDWKCSLVGRLVFSNRLKIWSLIWGAHMHVCRPPTHWMQVCLMTETLHSTAVTLLSIQNINLRTTITYEPILFWVTYLLADSLLEDSGGVGGIVWLSLPRCQEGKWSSCVQIVFCFHCVSLPIYAMCTRMYACLLSIKK